MCACASNFNALENHKDALLASLCSQVAFLKNVIEEKNLIRTLIIRDREDDILNKTNLSQSTSINTTTGYDGDSDDVLNNSSNVIVMVADNFNNVTIIRSTEAVEEDKNHVWPENTYLIVGDSIINNLEESKLTKKDRVVKGLPWFKY